MALHLYKYTGTAVWQSPASNPDWTEVDLTTNRVCDVRFAGGYSHPATLYFTMYAPQHTTPLENQTYIILTDDNYNSGNILYPVFEGRIWEVQPDEANAVRYAAYSADRQAAHGFFVMSGPSSSSVEAPRLVFNVPIEQDDDYAYERAHDRTTGQIIETLLDDQANLYKKLAAPDTATGRDAWLDADTDAMDYEPQDKVVFESETLRSAIDRMLQHYPNRRLIFHMGYEDGRVWRFPKVVSADQVTLTLNDPTASKIVLEMSLQRNLDRRYTAIKFYGPPNPAMGDETVVGGGLTELWSAGQEAAFISAIQAGNPVSADSPVFRKWQVADADNRRLLRLLPTAIMVPQMPVLKSGYGELPLLQRESRLPTLTANVNGTWYAISHIRLNILSGIVTAMQPVYTGESGGTVSGPDDVRFQFGYLQSPITARYPSSGYSGTAYSEANIAQEWRIYDESLAAGWEFYNPVISSSRIAKFEKLGKEILEAYQDIVYTGSITLRGIDYDWLRLNKRVNITAVDDDQNPITTGWESCNAILTDVEYDYDAQTTTLGFSSDIMEFAQQDTTILKRKYKIWPIATLAVYSTRLYMNTRSQLVYRASTRFHHIEVKS